MSASFLPEPLIKRVSHADRWGALLQANLESRSTVSLEDYGQNKYGTHINGKTLMGEKCVLMKDDNTLKLADYTELF